MKSNVNMYLTNAQKEKTKKPINFKQNKNDKLGVQINIKHNNYS